MVISKTLLGIISLLMNCFRTELLLWSPETVTVMYWTALSEISQDFCLGKSESEMTVRLVEVIFAPYKLPQNTQKVTLVCSSEIW